MTIRIANAAGFLGDQVDAPRRLAAAAAVDYLTLEYLAELTLSILARQREKDERAGFARDFLDVLESLCPALASQPQLRVVTNAGGMNPRACAQAAAVLLAKAGLESVTIGVVDGDDVTGRIDDLQRAGCDLANLDSGEPFETVRERVVSANAYLGAGPIVEALAGGARIVITGRVADASLTVGPAVHKYGWDWQNWDRLAGASVAGHLIECGAQVTGGYSAVWREHDLTDVGYPIAELANDGSAVITKPAGSGGVVNRQTVIEQLVYELGDPAHYLTPDVDVDFTTVEVEEVGPDRVAVRGATGRKPPDSYKVSLAYRDGWMASGTLLVYGEDAVEKARASAKMILDRVERSGYSLARTHVECLGAGDGVPGLRVADSQSREVVLRVAVHDENRDAVERFTREFAPLITSGTAGLAGYATGRSPVRPVFAYWPTLVPKDLVEPRVEVRSARDWTS